MAIPCKPEAHLIIEANALYVLNMKSKLSITWSDLAGKIQGLPNFLVHSFWRYVFTRSSITQPYQRGSSSYISYMSIFTQF